MSVTIVKVKGSSLSVKSGTTKVIFTIEEKKFAAAAAKLMKAIFNNDYNNFDKKVHDTIIKLEQIQRGKSKSKKKLNEQICDAVINIHKKGKSILEARKIFSESKELKILVGDKKATVKRIKNAFQSIYGTYDTQKLEKILNRTN